MTPPVTTQSKAQAQAHTMTPPVLTFDLSLDLSPLPLPPPYADVEGGAEQWQRELDEEWAQYVQTGSLCPPQFELTLADFEEMAEPDFSDDEFLVDDVDRRELMPSEHTEIGALLDIDDPNMRLEVLILPPSPAPRSSNPLSSNSAV